VEACAVKLAAMEGERTRPAVPTHREATAAESTSAEAATHCVRAHPTMRGHTTAASATTVSTAAVSTAAVSTTTVSATSVAAATVAAAAARRRNGWSKGDRCADCGGGGKHHDALSEHGSVLLPEARPHRRC
jgi:hypothetical protein